MLYLKLMSQQEFPDSNPSNDFKVIQLVDGEEVDFFNDVLDEDKGKKFVVARVTKRDGTTKDFHLNGTAYLLNQNGKTIAQRACY